MGTTQKPMVRKKQKARRAKKEAKLLEKKLILAEKAEQAAATK